jgi:3-phosphoshikimate 1-carboxyvinyltransferase
VAPRSIVVETIQPARCVRGTIRVPGDKSISHRYALLAALARGESQIDNYAPGADGAATLSCLAAAGVDVRWRGAASVSVAGRGLRGLRAPADPLDARNSGSTLRMLAGVLAAHDFRTILTGDASLRRRPMHRIAAPLSRMGAVVDTVEGCPPVTIRGRRLRGIDHAPDVPSAQVKSAVLLAGLQAEGTTIVREPAATRDHTEVALGAFGAVVERRGTAVEIAGGQALTACHLTVPGDLSSAAFWAVAAAALPGSDVEVTRVGLNPTRTGVLAALRRAGAEVIADPGEIRHGEPVGTVRVRHRETAPLVITPEEVPGLIDELPALAALGALGGGLTVTGAGELRGKESDRISALVRGLQGLGAEAEELSDGFVIAGSRRLAGGSADACGDHRLAMAFALAALGASGPSEVVGAACVDVSYPGFFDTLRSIRA